MNSVIIPVVLGYLLGNEKARNQLGASLQQLTGQGIDVLNSISKNQGDVNAEQSEPAD